MTLREDQVVSGLKFLQHPNVQSTPLAERVSFLEGKGMSKEEIQEAIERHQNGDTRAFTDQSTMQQQEMMTTPVAMTADTPMHRMINRRGRYPAYVQVLWTVSSLVGAASILTFLWNYAVQSGYIPWLRPMPFLLEAAKVQEEKENEAKKDDALLAELTCVSAAIQKQTEELAKMSLSLGENERDVHNKTLLSAEISSLLAQQGNAQSIAELKAEMSTLKALLLSKHTENASNSNMFDVVKKNSEDTGMKKVLTTGSKTVLTPNDTQPAVVLHTVSKAERMQKALKKLRTENSLEQLKMAAGILCMYVKNLIENPDVPRYRRIALGNANFTQKIEPLKHHEELLKSIGFEASGINMEWKWYSPSTTDAFDENIAILRAMLKALQSLSSPSASSNLSLEEIAHASLEEFFSQQGKKNTEMWTTATRTSIESSNIIEEKRSAAQSDSSASLGGTSTNLDEFMARLEQQTSVDNICIADASMTSPLPVSSASDGEEKMPSSTSNSNFPAVATDGPSYPESFKEVMDLIQKGETVPGIRDIEEKLSVDSSALLSEQMKIGETTVVKPWGQN